MYVRHNSDEIPSLSASTSGPTWPCGLVFIQIGCIKDRVKSKLKDRIGNNYIFSLFSFSSSIIITVSSKMVYIYE